MSDDAASLALRPATDRDVRFAPPQKPAVSDDVQFFEFARRHITLVTSVASIPIISSLTGVLPPPDADSSHTKLTIISSLLCLIVFSACFLVRGPLGMVTQKRGRLRPWVPTALTASFCTIAVILTAYYLSEFTPAGPGGPRGRSGASLFKLTLLYLAIFPSYVTALGIVLITAFSQQISLSISELVLSRPRGQSREFLDVVQNYYNFLSLADCEGNEALRAIGVDLLDPLPEQMASLARGEIVVSGSQTPKLQRMLHEHFGGRFDAVSYDDLEFWVSLEVDPLAMDYFRLNTDAVESGTIVTRVFIIKDKDLEENSLGRLVEVLQRHQQVGIGWAVAVYEELDPPLLQDHNAALDFALMVRRGPPDGAGASPGDDRVGAASFFRDYREIRRRYSAVFSLHTPKYASDWRIQEEQIQFNERRIWRHIRQHRLVITQCWMASQLFREACDNILNGPVPEAPGKRVQARDGGKSVKARLQIAANSLRNRLRAVVSEPGAGEQFPLLADMLTPASDDQLFLIEAPSGIQSTGEIEAAVKKLRDARLASKHWFKSRGAACGPDGNEDASAL